MEVTGEGGGASRDRFRARIPNRHRWIPGAALWDEAGRVAPRTPSNRDRVVDALRIGSLLVVVFGHVLMVVVRWHGEKANIANLLAEVPELKLATWALQVMPVFFAAGAISNRLSYVSATARGETWRGWVWHRVERVIRPVAFYLAIWIGLILVLALALPEAVGPLGKLTTQLLWFLGVYVVVIATTPWQIRLASIGYPAIAALVAGIALVDLGRFHIANGISVVNFVVVWFMAATYGLVMRDRVGRPGVFVAAALGAVALNIALVVAFPYPVSMVGLPGDRFSNMAPPTLVLALHAVVLISIIGMAWPMLERWCARPVLWQAMVAAGAATMTIYLWHLTALLTVTALEHGLGIARGSVDDAWFWFTTPAHMLAIFVTTFLVVSVAVVLEHTPVPWLERARTRPGTSMLWSVICGIGVFLCACGFLVLAATGMAGFPFDRVTDYAGFPLTPGVGFAFLVVGVLAVRTGGLRQPVNSVDSSKRPTTFEAAPTRAASAFRPRGGS